MSQSQPPRKSKEPRPGGSRRPPEKHLGLGFIMPPPPPLKENSTNAAASVSGPKRKASENESDSASPNVPLAITSSCSSAPTDGSGTQTQGQPQPNVIQIDDEAKPVPKQRKKRKKRCTSWVWEYFTRIPETVEVEGKQYEQLWGHCNFPKCKAKYRAESSMGTSGFSNHLKSQHSKVKGQQQLVTGKDHGKDISVVERYRYDPQVSLKKLYLAIIMHEYPFKIVEHEYFVEFITSLRPDFPIKSRVTARKDIIDIYVEEKDKLYAYLKTVNCRFSATMDMWTSCQNKSYMCVTIHWIDDEWRIQKRIVGFFHVEGRHTGSHLAQSFTEVMVKWYIEKKLFALTLDNAAANLVAVKDITCDLIEQGNVSLIAEELFHVRCACHVLNLVARDGLSVISKTLEKIQKLVVAVKSSPLQWEELMKRATECGLDTTKGLSLDVTTRWNSTYLMLRDALYYQPAFLRLKTSDRKRYDPISPSTDEWNMAITLYPCLRRFYDLTELLSGTSYPTANLFYRGFCEIKEILDKWCLSNDPTISAMATSMREKFNKYWVLSSSALAVACFLDPRYKHKLIELYMQRFYGDMYAVKVEEFLGVVRKMYLTYATSAATPSSTQSNAPHASVIVDPLMDDQAAEVEKLLYSKNQQAVGDSHELDKYMAAPLSHIQGPFDILAWWKSEGKIYPVLQQMARDVMAIQVSTVASESAFSAGGRVIDPYRSRLDPEMVEALICTKDWVAAARKDSKNVSTIMSDIGSAALESFVDEYMHEAEQR